MDRQLVENIRTALSVSAIGGIVIGLAWFMTYAGLIIAAPMWVLAWFQLKERKALLQSSEPRERASAVFRIGLWTLVFGLFNVVGLICGIVLLVLQGQLRDRSSGSGGPWVPEG